MFKCKRKFGKVFYISGIFYIETFYYPINEEMNMNMTIESHRGVNVTRCVNLVSNATEI